MEFNITAAYLAEHLAEVLDRVRDHGDTFVVERDGQNIATIGPFTLPEGPTWEKFVKLYWTFPRPDDKWADDLERVHAEMNQILVEPPEWPC